jgi:heme/copper-type cytochrome/quinol oxidase subunit 2
MKTDLFILLDAATEKQLYFQKPASQNMEMLIDLHNDIFSLLILICTIVIVLLTLILTFFQSDNFEIKRTFSFTHSISLETFWTAVPIIILTSIIMPSFVLLYQMDTYQGPVHYILKITGCQ